MSTSENTPTPEGVWIDVDALRAIDAGSALLADVEYDLEDRGLIVQTDAPYAVITPAGRALLERAERGEL